MLPVLDFLNLHKPILPQPRKVIRGYNDGDKQARSQDLEKGGGYFERVRSVQTTLTRIFIDLESVSDGLSEI